MESLGDSIAAMATPTAIGGISLGGDKYTASCCHDCKEEPNEEEDPRKRIQAETITKSSTPPGTVSMFKMLPQTDNQCSKVDMKHGKRFWRAICEIHVNNRYEHDFTIGRWGERNRNVGQKKALAKNIAIADLKKREKSVDTLNEKEKKQLNFGKKIKNLPLTAFLLKKRNNGGSGTKTPSEAGVASVSNAKTYLATSPPPK